MYFDLDWAVVIPMANEEGEFLPFVKILKEELDKLGSGKVYFVVDRVSKDRTLELCRELSEKDNRFRTIWAPENKNVVDAYIIGYKTAFKNGHKYILEMDAGLSHDPRAIPLFLKVLKEGNECAFGSRFIKGGSISESEFKRWFLSRFGTILANSLLGTRMHDMTSGFQGFKAEIVKLFVEYDLKSKAHFYQTEIRYLLRNKRYVEVPVHYRAPSPSVSKKAIKNAVNTLLHYFFTRITGKPKAL